MFALITSCFVVIVKIVLPMTACKAVQDLVAHYSDVF